MTDRELMQQALRYMESIGEMDTYPEDWAIAIALRERLSQPEQEPVAWMHNYIENNVITHRPADLNRHPDRWVALYKTPPPCPTCEALARTVMMDQTSHDTAPRQWQGLTDEDKAGIWRADQMTSEEWEELFSAIEAKLREKNT